MFLTDIWLNAILEASMLHFQSVNIKDLLLHSEVSTASPGPSPCVPSVASGPIASVKAEILSSRPDLAGKYDVSVVSSGQRVVAAIHLPHPHDQNNS